MTLSSGSGQFSGQQAQRPHLVRPGGGLSGEVADLRRDVRQDFLANVAFAVDEYTNEPAADVDGIKAAFASVTSIITYSGTDLDGAVGTSDMDAPRNVTITTGAAGTPADAPATATVTGLDIFNNVITEDITISQTAATVAGVLTYKSVTSVALTAGDGTGATLQIGFGTLMGLSKPLISRAGAAAVLMENDAGTMLAADAVTGTFVDAATAGPNGTYEPSTAQNGTADFAVWYEYNAAQNT